MLVLVLHDFFLLCTYYRRNSSADRSTTRRRRPEKFDAQTFRFDHFDHGLDRLPRHPCSLTSRMSGGLQDKLVIFCEVQVIKG